MHGNPPVHGGRHDARGKVSVDRSDPSSGIYITLGPQPALDSRRAAIGKIVGGKGTLEEICERIERNSDARDATLNWEMESGPRRIPVWTASVRKIINLNYGNRFKREAGDGDGPVYSLSR